MQAAIQTDIEAGRGPADAAQYGRPYAGGNQDTDNEGAIDTGDQSVQEDNSGAAPVMGGAIPGEDNSGAAPVMPASTQGGASDQQHFTPDLNPAHVPGNMKRIVSYLMGSDAVPPQALDQAAQQADPQGQMSPGDRNLVAIDKAAETGGQEAAWKLLQANRVAFNAKQAFARTALHGIQGKPADLNAAVDAANQAEQHIPDGSNVKFARSQNGVTATVTVPGTSQPQQIQLTPEQFDKWLDVGGDGQWDKAHQASVPATLQRLSKVGAVTGVPYKATSPAGDTQRPKTNVGKTPSSLNLSGSDEIPEPAPDTTGYDPQMKARAAKMFPNSIQQQDQWITAQEQREAEMQNKVDVAHETGENRIKAARETGMSRERSAQAAAGGRVDAAKLYSGAKLEAAKVANAAKIKQLEQSGANKQEEGQRKLAQTYLVTGQPVPPHLQKYIDNGTDAALATQGGQPQQRAPAQAAPAKQMSAHDQQAAAWAKANPNDPRAAQIMQKLGAQ